MASATYSLIASTTLTGSQATVTFSSIPSTYTDLCLKISARDTSAATGRWIRLRFNATTTNYSETYLSGTNSAAASGRTSATTYIGNSGWIASDGSTNTANTFGTTEIYIPSYLVSQNKPLSAISAEENNTAAANMGAVAGLWSNTAAITDIVIYANIAFDTGSSFYLYGIKNA